MMTPSAPHSPFRLTNVRMFIAFRVFFNARFYYPVFTILFLDFGLTLDQFALLNAAWAAAIVTLEVPSGALADIVGRRNLVVAAAVIMVVEILLLCVAPQNGGWWLFSVFLVNRILSGAAEASASGADEALAYDALKQEGDQQDWGRVLDIQMRMQSIGFIAALSLGAFCYDADLLNRIFQATGLNWRVTAAQTLRFPLFLTLVMALMALASALRMKEEPLAAEECRDMKRCSRDMAAAFRLTVNTGRWILRTPFVLVVMLTGLVFDPSLRLVITLNSEYFRQISLPEASFGLIGSGIALLGLVIPRLARFMAERYAPWVNLFMLAGLTLSGLTGLIFFVPYGGLAPIVLLFASMTLLQYFLSHYLNTHTPSDRRATVLSFKGLALNLGYGLIGLLYAGLIYGLRSQMAGQPDVESQVFRASFAWLPVNFIVTFGLLLVASRHTDGANNLN